MESFKSIYMNRISGYELLSAPSAVCHEHVSMELILHKFRNNLKDNTNNDTIKAQPDVLNILQLAPAPSSHHKSRWQAWGKAIIQQ